MFIAVESAGQLSFGFGAFSAVRDHYYRLWIGGLHAFSLTKGVYGAMAMADVFSVEDCWRMAGWKWWKRLIAPG